MKYLRLYAGPDGDTHFEDADMEMGPVPGRSNIGRSWPASEAIFIAGPADSRALDVWHNAPARQFIVLLSGETEIEASDGEVRRLSAGQIVLVEDTVGKGHKTRHFGERTAIHIPIGDAG